MEEVRLTVDWKTIPKGVVGDVGRINMVLLGLQDTDDIRVDRRRPTLSDEKIGESNVENSPTVFRTDINASIWRHKVDGEVIFNRATDYPIIETSIENDNVDVI